jgi:hypothetical protein
MKNKNERSLPDSVIAVRLIQVVGKRCYWQFEDEEGIPVSTPSEYAHNDWITEKMQGFQYRKFWVKQYRSDTASELHLDFEKPVV